MKRFVITVECDNVKQLQRGVETAANCVAFDNDFYDEMPVDGQASILANSYLTVTINRNE